VLTNAWPNPLRDAIPRAFLDTVERGAPTRDWVGEIETATTAVLNQMFAAPFPQDEPPADAAPALPLAAYAGGYANDLFGEVTVREDDGGLVLELGPRPIRFPRATGTGTRSATPSRAAPRRCTTNSAWSSRSGRTGKRRR